MSWKYAARSRISLPAPGVLFLRISNSIAPLEPGCCDDH